ncbi:MAG: methyltransferase [Planctomycetota bacterium]
MTTTHAFDPAEALILDEWSATDPAGNLPRVAILGSEDLAIAEVVAERAAAVTVYPRQANDPTAANPLPSNVTVSDTVTPSPDASLDAVLLPIPQGRYLSRMLIAAARAALRDGGELWLAGPSTAGAKPVIADAISLLGEGEVVAFKHRQRLARCVKHTDAPIPDWATEPGVAPGTFGGFEIDLAGTRTTVKTRPGVFAWDGLDETTRLILEHVDIPAGTVVANPCCGAGTLGLHAANAGAAQVDLSDHDALAVRAAQAGIEANGLTDRATVTAHPCGRFAPDAAYDLILAFPPMNEPRVPQPDGRAAPRAIEQLLDAARPALAPAGRLVVAVPAFVNLDKPLRRAGLTGQPLAESRRARVIEARVDGSAAPQ